MKEYALYMAVGLSAAFLVEGSYLAFTADRARVKKVKVRLAALQENPAYTKEERRIVKQRLLSGVPGIHRLLLSIPGTDLLALDLERAGLATTAATILAWTLAAAALGFVVPILFGLSILVGALVAASLATLPFVYVWSQKLSRVQKFSAQLPEGIDLLVRSLKAGHSLPSGFHLIAEELADPIAREFSFLHEELNLGRTLEDALDNLRERIDTPDVRLLNTSILIQRETGGNLVEILENLADMVRKRHAFRDKLSSLTAEGRMSGTVLMALPPVMVVILCLLNPSYGAMLTEPGTLRYLLAFGGILQVGGILWIRSIVAVRY